MNTGRDMRVFSSNGWGLIRQACHKPPYPAGMPKPRPVDQQDFIDLDRRRHGYQADEPQVNTGLLTETRMTLRAPIQSRDGVRTGPRGGTAEGIHLGHPWQPS